jgi:hypothetical protein
MEAGETIKVAPDTMGSYVQKLQAIILLILQGSDNSL